MEGSEKTSAFAVSGYVLAGGRSSRMGRDKALLELSGRPLIAHAVAKLRRVTGEANILAGAAPGNEMLATFGSCVFDMQPDCGPLGGIEAALRHSARQWTLILPVDVPFLPAALLEWWVGAVSARGEGRCFVSTIQAGDRPQPTVLLLHRSVAPVLSSALARGEYKLLPVLREAARQLAPADARVDEIEPYIVSADDAWSCGNDSPRGRPPFSLAQLHARELWFLNLNTPEDLAEAERNADALDGLCQDERVTSVPARAPN